MLIRRVCSSIGRQHGAARSTATSTAPKLQRRWLSELSNVESAPGASPSRIQNHSKHQHAVISAFDLFSIGIGPSSSHTLGPFRAAGIFIGELEKASLLERCARLKISLYGSLALTGAGHMTAEALMMGFQGHDPETIDTNIILPAFRAIEDTKALSLGGKHKIAFDLKNDIRWSWDKVLPEHSNGMLFQVYDKEGDLLAVNTYFSIGGGFVVTPRSLQVGGENVYYKQTDRTAADPARRGNDAQEGQPATLPLGTAVESVKESNAAAKAADSKWSEPPMPFASGDQLLALCESHDLTVAQIVWENERHYLSDKEIKSKLLHLWRLMDRCIAEGVTTNETHLPGVLNLPRRAPKLYRRLMRGFYPTLGDPVVGGETGEAGAAAYPNELGLSTRPSVRGRLDHPLQPTAPRKFMFPALEWLSTYAIAVNEVNASGGRIVIAPTAGASGTIPSVLKYVTEFISQDPEKDVMTFLLTASAIGMLFKRGATISAAEGGCMAEVGVATSCAAAGFTAIMGGTPQQILQAAEIGAEHSQGLTCDPVAGLVQVPCIERNAIGAVKAVSAAQLALSGDGKHLVSLDEAIASMREVANDMHMRYRETSLGGLATNVKVRIPVSVPSC